MNRLEYNAYIKKIEARFDGKPEALRKKALFFVVLSYLYIAGVLALTMALLVGLVALVIYMPNALTIKLGLVLGITAGVLGFSILRGLWVKSEPPSGRILKRDEAPLLFEMLDDLRKKVAPVKFHKVIVDGDFNAAVVQYPRLGMLGWYQNYLLLGLPLMQATRPDEFTGVLAHEFAHLSNSDGSSGSWIYRIRVSWEKMIEKLYESGGGGSWALVPFVNWFWPRFNGHAFVLSRLHEYRADATAAKYAGADAIGRALQRIELRGRWLEEEVWPPIFQKANDDPAVPENVYEFVKSGIIAPVPDEEAETWLTQSFARKTDNSDTHPALSDRLAAVNSQPTLVLPPVTESAATAFFGAATEQKLIDELSLVWANHLRDLWKERHRDVQEIREQLGDESEVGDAESAWKWAGAMLDLEGDQAALPWIERTLGYNPDHVAARFVKARHLLVKGDLTAIPMLEKLAEKEGDFSLEALGLLRMHYSNNGDIEKLAEIDQKADEYDELMELAQKERAGILAAEVMIAHELSEETLNSLRAVFAKAGSIKEVYIARKKVIYLPNRPFYIIGIAQKAMTTTSSDETLVNNLLSELESIMDSGYFIFLAKSDMKAVGKKMKAMAGALVYQKQP